MARRVIIRSAKILLSLILIPLFTIIAVELSLRLIDPHGIAYFDDLSAFYGRLTPDPSGYAMPPGEYQFSHWRMTVDSSGRRITPDAVTNGPRVLFYGDSAAMCWGVDDSACWINLVSDRLQLAGVNYGRNTYNAANIFELVEMSAGDDCAVVLGVNNDMDLPAEHFVFAPRAAHDSRSYIERYIGWFVYRNYLKTRGGIPEQSTFEPAMIQLMQRPNTLVLAYGSYGDDMAERFGVTSFPEYTSYISTADPHPNEEGNRQIADHVTPIIEDWLADRDCT